MSSDCIRNYITLDKMITVVCHINSVLMQISIIDI